VGNLVPEQLAGVTRQPCSELPGSGVSGESATPLQFLFRTAGLAPRAARMASRTGDPAAMQGLTRVDSDHEYSAAGSRPGPATSLGPARVPVRACALICATPWHKQVRMSHCSHKRLRERRQFHETLT
jgi:hypothetical protein